MSMTKKTSTKETAVWPVKADADSSEAGLISCSKYHPRSLIGGRGQVVIARTSRSDKSEAEPPRPSNVAYWKYTSFI